ncbi:hypothetical protein L914_09122 [Phytophthora nicotianae]|uniref:Uncharacterized protein n=1 Tax=Phytophthora nicotianae TaxID=4792 RepID=W2NBK6_PHYNI|nr:hypothetical protein L914_09122 [Phytophthora nicotianae]
MFATGLPSPVFCFRSSLSTGNLCNQVAADMQEVVFSQAQYVRELLQRFHMAAYIGVRTLEPYGALHVRKPM